MSTLDFNGIHKAAVLLSALDWEKADDLLKRLDEMEARAIRHELARLQNVTEDEVRYVAESFLRLNRETANSISFDTFESSKNAYPMHFVHEENHFVHPQAEESAFSTSKMTTCQSTNERFGFLENMSPLETASFLVDESPQVIALVLSELSPQYSGETLLCFEQELRMDLIQRLAVLEETSDVVLEEIEKLIQTRYESSKAVSNSQNRKNVLGEILKYADDQMEQEIRMGLEFQPTYSDSAYDTHPEEMTFEHLGLCEDHELAAIYHAIHPDIAAMSLIHLDPDFLARIFNSYSAENKLLMNDLLLRYRDISYNEIQYARKCVLQSAIQLIEQGIIAFPQHHCLTV